MSHRGWLTGIVGSLRRAGALPTLVATAGGILVLLAVFRATTALQTGASMLEVGIDSVLIASPSLALLYTGYWLPRSSIQRRYYPRILAWLLGGVALMFGFIALRDLHPGVSVDWSLGTQVIALTIGSIGGLLIGIQETQASMRKDHLEERTRTLEERTRELAQRERELARQNEQLEEFASIISHDLRNPLNVASSRLALARETGEDEHLDHVADAHERMETLIDDLLTLARQGRKVGSMGDVSLEELAAECWGNVATAAATLDVETSATVRADPDRLAQLLENLIRNAVEHGGDDVRVRIGELPGTDGFFVEDDGPGIPEDDRRRILESGFSTVSEGTGFGLAIVEEIVAAHGWDLRVTEGTDGGARFEVSQVEFAR